MKSRNDNNSVSEIYRILNDRTAHAMRHPTELCADAPEASCSNGV